MNNHNDIGALFISVAAIGLVGYAGLKTVSRWISNEDEEEEKISIVTSYDSCQSAVQRILQYISNCKVLGLDCEWISYNQREPVALLQLSCPNGYTVLFRLCMIKDHIPLSLRKLLEDKDIWKVGVGIDRDVQYLRNDYGVIVRSFLDIRYVAKEHYIYPGGLARLSVDVLGIGSNKSSISWSDWEADKLSPEQVKYAAEDAQLSFKIYEALIYKYKSNTYMYDDYQPRQLKKYIDMPFKMKSNKETSKSKETTKVMSKKYPSHATRKQPLYDNCLLLAPDGDLLCTCDTKKALWYVQKNLATLVTETPMTVQLLFEPAGRSVGTAGQYYQTTKENLCVVCGNAESYLRKNVVPREYRKFFPDILKERVSHDVLLLCVNCHKLSNIHDQEVRIALGKLCSAPLPVKGDSAHRKYFEDNDLKKVKSAGRALSFQSKKHNLPPARRKELEEIILKYFKEESVITNDLIDRAANLQIVYENADYESHGGKVVDYFLQNGGLFDLEKYWRQHFLDTMKPRYLPPLWSVKHNEERMKIKYEDGRVTKEHYKSIGVIL